jgi:hypothetical protein
MPLLPSKLEYKPEHTKNKPLKLGASQTRIEKNALMHTHMDSKFNTYQRLRDHRIFVMTQGKTLIIFVLSL